MWNENGHKEVIARAKKYLKKNKKYTDVYDYYEKRMIKRKLIKTTSSEQIHLIISLQKTQTHQKFYQQQEQPDS